MALKVEVHSKAQDDLLAEMRALSLTHHAVLLELQQMNVTLRQIANELSPDAADDVVGIGVKQTGTIPH